MNEMRKKAIEHYRELASGQPQYSAKRMAELAPGVVAVEDQSGECDALFDTAQCQFTNPKLWEREPESESPMLRKAGLKVLEGLGQAPQVSTIEDMVGFARRHLSLKGNQVWHDTPQFFTA